jgi:hypothetical protein
MYRSDVCEKQAHKPEICTHTVRISLKFQVLVLMTAPHSCTALFYRNRNLNFLTIVCRCTILYWGQFENRPLLDRAYSTFGAF